MSHQTTISTDMILAMTSKGREQELIHVSTKKCVLGTNESNGTPQCVILRGSKGAALKCFDGEVLVNDAPKTVHWLAQGDQIKFANSTEIEVKQLGSVSEVCTDASRNETADATTATPTAEPLDPMAQQRIDQLETQIGEIKQQNQEVVGRFDDIDNKFNQLSDQLSSLVNLASGATAFPAQTQETNIETAGFQAQACDSATCDPATCETENCNSENSEQELAQSEQTVAATEDPTEVPTATSDSISQVIQNLQERIAQPEASNPVVRNNEFASEWSAIEGTPDTSFQSSNDIVEPIEPNSNEVEAAVTETESLHTSATGFIDSMSQDSTGQTAEVEPSEPVAPAAEAQPAPETNYKFDVAQFETPSEESSSSATEPVESVQTELEQDVPSGLFASEEEKKAAASEEGESVSDLLERLKAEGEWDGVPDENESELAEPVAIPPAPEMIPAESDAETDVDDYMSQLLSRMRGEEEPAKPSASKPKKKEPAAIKKDQPEKKKEAVEMLKAEEFVPKQKAKRLDSLSAMREIANMNSRTAVQSSDLTRRKADALTQLAIAIGAAIMGLYYIFSLCVKVPDTSFCIGLLCFGVTSYLGYKFYQTMFLGGADSLMNVVKNQRAIASANKQVATVAAEKQPTEAAETTTATEVPARQAEAQA